jgi:predicted molibdopterin-dependent oxidoreductase YjgC
VTRGNLCVKGRFGFEYVHHGNTKDRHSTKDTDSTI